MSIKELFRKTEKLYHFTSFETALKIIESNSLKFGRLNNMNDIHENDKISFVDGNERSSEKFPLEVLNELQNEIYKYRQISLTADAGKEDKNGFDLHQMWGLYADKGEGVCIVIDKNELEVNIDNEHIHNDRVNYEDSKELESFVISESQKTEEVVAEIKARVNDLFFYKRKEWEHEQEFRLLKRCPVATHEEYLSLGYAIKFIILTSKLRSIDETLYFNKIKDIKDKLNKVAEIRNEGMLDCIPILIYGNSLFDYSLCTEDGEEELWNSNYGYDTLVIGESCELALQ